jgi:hypothetical protein
LGSELQVIISNLKSQISNLKFHSQPHRDFDFDFLEQWPGKQPADKAAVKHALAQAQASLCLCSATLDAAKMLCNRNGLGGEHSSLSAHVSNLGN